MIKVFVTLILSLTSICSFANPELLKNKVFADLSMLSETVDINELKEITPQISRAELDLVFYRLTKEIEKIPEFDLGEKNFYDIRLIQALIEVIYIRSSQDNLAAINKVKNLAGRILYVFPIYSDLFIYQLDSAAIRANIKKAPDEALSRKLTLRMKMIDGHISRVKKAVLSRDLSNYPTEHLDHLLNSLKSCSSLFI